MRDHQRNAGRSCATCCTGLTESRGVKRCRWRSSEATGGGHANKFSGKILKVRIDVKEMLLSRVWSGWKSAADQQLKIM
jgi:hypothetical protein